jgi:hypothetical protein
MEVIAVFVQIVCVAGLGTSFGIGFTTTADVTVVPKEHPLAFNGVMVNVTVIGAFVVFVKDPVALPVPLAAMPVTVAVLSLVQLRLLTAPVIPIGPIAEPEQVVCVSGLATELSVGVNSSAPISGGVPRA